MKLGYGKWALIDFGMGGLNLAFYTTIPVPWSMFNLIGGVLAISSGMLNLWKWAGQI